MNQLETSKQLVGLKVMMPCKNERTRMASSGGVVLVILGILALTFQSVYTSNKEIKTSELEQTAIARAFAQAGTAMIVLGGDAKILYWDENSTKLFGHTKYDVLDKSVDKIVPGNTPHEQIIRRAVSDKGGVQIVQCSGENKAGEKLDLILRIYPEFKKDQILVLADEIKPDTITKR